MHLFHLSHLIGPLLEVIHANAIKNFNNRVCTSKELKFVLFGGWIETALGLSG